MALALKADHFRKGSKNGPDGPEMPLQGYQEERDIVRPGSGGPSVPLPKNAVAGQVQRPNPRLPRDRQAADGIREVDMAQTRGILLASIVLGLSVSINPAAARRNMTPGPPTARSRSATSCPTAGRYRPTH